MVTTFIIIFHILLFAEEESNEIALAGVLEAVAQLPPCNKDTLAFIMLHLQK